MSDCFISYKREDRERVGPIVHGLRAAGHTVWWDADLDGGAHWRSVTEAELDNARCVVVCWTRNATAAAGSYTHDEAERAKRRRVLLPLLLDDVALPLGFGEVQALSLVGWNGDPKAPAWQSVLRGVDAVLTGKPLPPSVPRWRGRRWAWVGLAAAAITLAANVVDLQATLCTPDRFGETCAWVGLGPDARDVKAWNDAMAAADRGAALRAYLAAHPTGAYAAEAQARLQSCRREPQQTWAPHAQKTVAVVLKDRLAAGWPNEVAARDAARGAVQRGAEDACAAYHSELYRAVAGAAAQPAPEGWRCTAEAGGWRCGFDGPVACTLEKVQATERDVCPQ